MEQTFSRRGFLKGAAAAALAVSAMGLTGCAGEDSPTTAVVLGDYKVDVDVRKSTRRSDTRNNKTTGILLPVVYITNFNRSRWCRKSRQALRPASPRLTRRFSRS